MAQSQASLYEQLLQVRALANKSGYYDAADFITKHIEDIEGRNAHLKTIPGKFYIQFFDEDLATAIESHSVGFSSIEDAKGEAEALHAGQGIGFKVLNHALAVVFEGNTSKSQE